MPEFNVEILPEAMAELREIAVFHHQAVEPVSARKITDKILHDLERLKMFPQSCPLAPDPELSAADYRVLVSGKYICVYRLMGKTVFVYHIAHGSRDYPNLFK